MLVVAGNFVAEAVGTLGGGTAADMAVLDMLEITALLDLGYNCMDFVDKVSHTLIQALEERLRIPFELFDLLVVEKLE